MRIIVYILNFFLLIGLISSHFIGKITARGNYLAIENIQSKAKEIKAPSKSIYDYSFKTLDGKTVPISQFKGKKILFVNTASECGYTPQYKQLQEVYEKYRDKLVIIGFPTNDFGKQEPGSNKEIKTFCSANYGVTFPMSEKITVKGDQKAAIYQWLTSKELNGKEDSDIKWNFQKYLVDENGKLIMIYNSKIKPDDASVLENITK